MYINDQNRKAVEEHIFNLMEDVKRMRGTLALNKKGIEWVGGAAYAHYNQFGKIDWKRVAELVDEAQSYAPLRLDYPHPDCAQLAWLTSVDDYADATSEVIRRYMQPVAIDSGLKHKFDDRVTYLRNNKIRRPKVEAAPEPPQLTPAQKVEAEVKARIQAMADRINSSVGKGWNTRTAQFRKRLLGEANELLTGGQNLAYVEKYVAERIRDHENGSIR